jgi:hypothetical protein
MCGTVTLAELLSAKNYSQLTHPCAICGKAVWLTNNTPTDKNGRALHDHCEKSLHYPQAA